MASSGRAAADGPHHAELNDEAGAGRLCLVAMPFASLAYPSLAVGLLAGQARREQWRVDERFFSFDFARMLGVARYLFLTDEAHYQALLGEWIFAGAVFDQDDSAAMTYLSGVLTQHVEPLTWLALMGDALEARRQAGAFAAECAAAVAETRPDVVGVTSSFQQVLPSIAFVRALRGLMPDVTIIMGGANCEGPLGQALMDEVPELDAVCTGEGDDAFRAFLRAWRRNRPIPAVSGIATRAERQTGAPELITALDDLPVPDFSAFVEQFHTVPDLSDIIAPVPTIETSRGCWWGAKHHCTFCGLNGQTMTYRSKSAERAFEEFSTQADRYGADFIVVDNILDYRYFDDLLPRLAQDERPFMLHYEVKANLSPKAIRGMARAGVRKIQPGIETLDSGILRLMRKGVTALQNVQTLKLAVEAGIHVDWGFIHGFPGETAEAYDSIAAMVPLLHHLQAPAATGPVRADRFSPYFESPEAFGIALKPSAPYAHIFPFEDEALARFVYHFDIVPRDDHPAAAIGSAVAAVKTWQDHCGAATLYRAQGADGSAGVIDGRGPAGEVFHAIDRAEALILDAAAVVAGLDAMERLVSERAGAGRFEPARDRLVELGFLLIEGHRALALPLRTPGYVSAPDWASIRSGQALSYAERCEDAFLSTRVPA